jgi:hypothetical protein
MGKQLIFKVTDELYKKSKQLRAAGINLSVHFRLYLEQLAKEHLPNNTSN